MLRYVVGGLFVCLLIAGIYLTIEKEKKNKIDLSLRAPKPKPVYEVSVNDLMAAYAANEIAADEQYKGKSLVVSGVISKIGVDFLDKPFVYFDIDKNGIRQVHCFFKHKNDVMSLRIGQAVKVQGTCEGMETSVGLRDCMILN